MRLSVGVVSVVLVLGAPGCLKLSTDAECQGLSLAACEAQGATCAVISRCEGPSPACADRRVCSDTCRSAGQRCLRDDNACFGGDPASGVRCKRVELSRCPRPGPRLEDGGAGCLDFDCALDPDPCEACQPALVRCAGRPTPLFGR